MSTLSKEQWLAIEKQLSHSFGSVKLLIDGHPVTLQVERLKELSYGIAVYVDGSIKGQWLSPGHEMQQRFYQISRKSLYSAADKKKFEKNCGKRAAKKFGMYRKYEYVLPYWRSFRQLKNHLIKNNQSIALASNEAAA